MVERLPAPRGPAAARNAGLLMAASMGAAVGLAVGAPCNLVSAAANWPCPAYMLPARS